MAPRRGRILVVAMLAATGGHGSLYARNDGARQQPPFPLLADEHVHHAAAAGVSGWSVGGRLFARRSNASYDDGGGSVLGHDDVVNFDSVSAGNSGHTIKHLLAILDNARRAPRRQG